MHWMQREVGMIKWIYKTAPVRQLEILFTSFQSTFLQSTKIDLILPGYEKIRHHIKIFLRHPWWVWYSYVKLQLWNNWYISIDYHVQYTGEKKIPIMKMSRNLQLWAYFNILIGNSFMLYLPRQPNYHICSILHKDSFHRFCLTCSWDIHNSPSWHNEEEAEEEDNSEKKWNHLITILSTPALWL